MVDNKHRSSCGIGHPPAVTGPALKPSARILLVLGLLAWPTVESLRAQQSGPPADPPTVAPSSPKPARPAASKPAEPAPQPAQPDVRILPPAEFAATPVATAMPVAPRFQFNIAPNTPLKDLLPVPPRLKKTAGPLMSEDLAKVPEVDFQAPLAKDVSSEEAMKQTAHMIARINHLNGKRADGFLEALRGGRPDLIGLPLAMGDACRTKGERSRQFALAVATVRGALQQRGGATMSGLELQSPRNSSGPAPAVATDRNPAETFWEQYHATCAQEDKKLSRIDRAQREHVTRARIAALMQVLAPESPSLRLGLVKYLSTVSHVEATRALARLAIFSTEDEVRQAAVDTLKIRRERDYTDILMRGLRYPWPAVARRAGDALVKLERTDLVPQLVELLDEPDPRAPVHKDVDQKRVSVVRELVRINHHRNCLLCHAPGNTGKVSPEAVTAAVPVPNEPLPSPADGYRTSVPDLLVRVDVTYLRQDFSEYQPVEDANPWPEMQRFDFAVRTRVLTDNEAAAYRDKLASGGRDRPSPYQRAALTALRELTGRDAEPTPESWRRLLRLPAPQRRAALPRESAQGGKQKT